MTEDERRDAARELLEEAWAEYDAAAALADLERDGVELSYRDAEHILELMDGASVRLGDE